MKVISHFFCEAFSEEEGGIDLTDEMPTLTALFNENLMLCAVHDLQAEDDNDRGSFDLRDLFPSRHRKESCLSI